ncbi:MAG: PD-(D/E)XK nuclease family protein [Syntrophales bacterium]|jgi:RecB family exonuclease|nr:PD-(D/E)XK nuclease family protein [Syntrophales bacterium]MCK9528333.1 PD-(D/E)XK nuclease family protein [Syntrophales bacterium]MDX9922171.1 PD-(D/E)XK nuclease family protein [Syntrophales bacterium]
MPDQQRSSRLILTSTERLARSLQRASRDAFLKGGARGWERPDIISLNAWLDREWADSWPERAPAPDLLRLALWKQVVDEFPPPAPLEGRPSLYQSLDETCRILIRHRIDTGKGLPSTGLVEWRRSVCSLFLARLAENGLFHPAETVLHVRKAIEEGSISPPENCSIMGFESPAPVEEDLFDLMGRASRTVRDLLTNPVRGSLRALSLPTREQEITCLCRCLAEDARTVPLHRIGVIVPELEHYGRELATNLEEVLGRAASPRESWFNITLGDRLSHLPLFRAALLPLRMFLEGESRSLLLSLILSPYYRCWQSSRATVARADRIWRANGVTGGLKKLRRSLRGAARDLESLVFNESAQVLHSLETHLEEGRAPLSSWIGTISDCWDVLGFPVMADETDRLAWRHLRELTGDFLNHMGDTTLTGGEFLDWLTHQASLQRTQPERAEDAGIQIMGMIEARGLTFDRLYLLDANDRSLPRPVRPLPFLDSAERAMVQGGTTRSQFDFADIAINRILHSALSIVFMRAEQEDTVPLTPSPFWPRNEERTSINIWTNPDPAWLRASWLKAAWEGLSSAETDDGGPPIGTDTLPFHHPAFPEKHSRGLSSSRLKTVLTCPFLFLVEILLAIEPLEDVTTPPSPQERGRRIHDILASFTAKLREQAVDPVENREQAWDLLSRCVDAEFIGLEDHPAWGLEKKRLLGSPESDVSGVLASWLEAERTHRGEGWLCRAEEKSFQGLVIDDCPFPLNGRIDRVDYHETEGWSCYDYKTGRIPTRADICRHFTEPQLAVYLLALRDRVIPDLAGGDERLSLHGGGYIQVKSAGDIRYQVIHEIAESLASWEAIVADAGRLIAEGRFNPDPWPLVPEETNKTEPCRDCSVRMICSRGLLRELSRDDEEETDNDREGRRDD